MVGTMIQMKTNLMILSMWMIQFLGLVIISKQALLSLILKHHKELFDKILFIHNQKIKLMDLEHKKRGVFEYLIKLVDS